VANLVGGAKTEIFTTFLYPLATAGLGTSPMSLSNSSLFMAPTFRNGRCFLNLDGFAPAADWEEHSASVASSQEAAHDL